MIWIVVLSLCAQPSLLSSNNDISTLELLQVVHRHGDRTINRIYPNDPFKDMAQFWPEGLGQLTTKGKREMYGLGMWIRDHYGQFLGNEFSPREVYVRSSAKPRCLESVQCLLAGAYPPKSAQWQWSDGNDTLLGTLWQPFPVATFIPMDDDRLLRTETYCPKCTRAQDAIERSDYVQNILKKERPFLDQLSSRIGYQIRTTMDAKNVHDFLSVEYERGLNWSDHVVQWAEDYQLNAVHRLLPLAELLWKTEWNSTLVQRTRAGPLLSALVNNIKSVTNSSRTQSRKLMVYSTHDAMIGVLLQALKVFNDRIIPITALLFFELHRKPETDSHFVRIYYLNETSPQMSPHLLQLPECDHLTDCPVDRFFAITDQLIPENWELECGLSPIEDCLITNPLTLSLIILNSILFIVLSINLVIICVQTRKRHSYEQLK